MKGLVACALVSLLTSACSATSETPTTLDLTATGAAVPSDSAAATPPPATSAPPPKSEAFLDPAVDVKNELPLRAKLLRAGAMYETASSGAANKPDGRSVILELVALDPGAARVRLLCDDGPYRVAMWVDRSDLAHVAVKPALVAPTMPTAPVKPETPGIHLEVGTRVDLLPDTGAAPGTLSVRYDGLFIRGSGLADATTIGEVYDSTAEREAPPMMKADGEIPKKATFLDSPGGKAIAIVGKSAGILNTLHFEKLADVNAGHLFVRYEDTDDASVVGWVKVGDLQVYAKRKQLGEGGGGSGYGEGRPREPVIEIPAGKRLVGVETNVPLGVTLEKKTYHCEDACGTPSPVIEVYACTGNVRVRVQP